MFSVEAMGQYSLLQVFVAGFCRKGGYFGFGRASHCRSLFLHRRAPCRCRRAFVCLFLHALEMPCNFEHKTLKAKG